MHLFSGSAIAAAFSALFILILGIAAGVRGRASSAGVLFFGVTAAVSGWLASFAMMYASTNADAALMWARLGNFFAALVAPAIFHFAAIYVGRARALRNVIAASWALCAILGILSTTSLLIPSVQRFAWGFYPKPSLYLAPAVVIYIGTLGNGVRLLFAARSASEGRARERASMLLVAFGIGALTILDYIPTLGIGPVGHIAMFAFTVVAATAIWRFQLVDVTPEYAAESILETMKSAVLVVDMAGNIRVANKGVGALLGYDPDSLPGAHIRLIIQRDSNETTGQLLNSSGVLEQNMVWRGANRARVDVLVACSRFPE